MGSRERRKKNMVGPSWGSFQKPNQINTPPTGEGPQEQHEVNEFEQEFPGMVQDEMKPEAEKPEWGNFETPETHQAEPKYDPDEESFFSMVARNSAENAKILVSKVAGAPGDLQQISTNFIANMPSSGGFFGNAIAEWIGKDKWEKVARSTQHLPTSETVKKNLDYMFGKTPSKSEKEKVVNEVVGDVGGVLGGTATFGGALRARNILGIPGVANVVKQTAKWLGFGEEESNLAKMAVWLPMALLSNVNGPAHASRMMNAGRQGIPQALQSNVPRLTRNLNQLERSTLMLGSDPRSALARQQINLIRENLANGQTNVRSLMTAYDGVNAAKRGSGMFELGRTDRNFARERINEVNRIVRDEIVQSSQAHPEAINNWQNGLTAWATVHQSNAITNWVEKLARGPYVKLLQGPTAALFGFGSYGAITAPLVGGAVAAGGPAAYKSFQTMYRMWQNPDLAQYYWGAISAAQAENLPVFIKQYEKLSEKLENSKTAKKKAKAKK